MNSLIKKQLDSVKSIQLPEYNDNTTHLVIPKQEDYTYVSFREGHQYIVELDNSIIFPPADSSLHANWNHNIIPKDKIMQVVVRQIMGSMVNFSGYGFDKQNNQLLNSFWMGWVPTRSVKIIREV